MNLSPSVNKRVKNIIFFAIIIYATIFIVLAAAVIIFIVATNVKLTTDQWIQVGLLIVTATALFVSIYFNIISIRETRKEAKRVRISAHIVNKDYQLNEYNHSDIVGRLNLVIKNDGPGIAHNIKIENISVDGTPNEDIAKQIVSALNSIPFIKYGINYLAPPNFLEEEIIEIDYINNDANYHFTLNSRYIFIKNDDFPKITIKFTIYFSDSDNNPCPKQDVSLTLGTYLHLKQF